MSADEIAATPFSMALAAGGISGSAYRNTVGEVSAGKAWLRGQAGPRVTCKYTD